MALFDDRIEAQIRKRLATMREPVTLVFFTQELECESCREAHQLLEELAALSDKLRLEVYDFILDKEKVAEFGVDKVPATVIVGDSARAVRFYGVPAGYEFASLLEDILMVSNRDSGLAVETRAKLRELREPLHLQVFVTPT